MPEFPCRIPSHLESITDSDTLSLEILIGHAKLPPNLGVIL
jgi:hypothetical protein